MISAEAMPAINPSFKNKLIGKAKNINRKLKV
jgi:hypothetical protein